MPTPINYVRLVPTPIAGLKTDPLYVYIIVREAT
jgi:hypothetical protein